MRVMVVARWLPLLAFLLALHSPLLGAAEVPADGPDLQRGVELYRAGKSQEALSHLRGFVLRHAKSPLLPEAYLYLARIFREAGSFDEALIYLDRIPEERKTAEGRLIEGAALVGAGQVERGVKLLQDLEKIDFPEADRRLRLQVLADGQVRLGHPLQGLFFLHRLLLLPGSRTEDLLPQAHILLRDRLSDAELEEATFMFSGTAFGEDARLQRALRAFARGNLAEARKSAGEVVRSTVPFPYRREAVLLLERMDGGGTLERTVGVILPLSGRYASFGELVRRGMELALQLQADKAMHFIFLDAETDAEKSANAVSELANEHRVMAIAGPLTGTAAAAAATRAEELKIPLLTLSQRDGLVEPGDYVFRDSLTPRLQAQALAQYAIEERKLTTFGILFPENKLGREMVDLFSGEVAKRGGKVIAQQSYAENDTDFRTQVRLLQGRDPEIADEKEKKEARKPVPPPFQALFIPDYADRVGLIAPQLVYYGLEGVQLLGINGWNSPELLRTAGDYVEGAVFVDGFFRYSPYPFVKEFVNLYFEKYGEEPSILEAQGYDAACILLSLLSEPKIKTREDLRLGLSRLTNYPGVTGATTFNPQGDAEKILFLLQVHNGDIVQIN